jgi:hypothetical protein
MHIIVLAPGPEAVETFHYVSPIWCLDCRSGVPANAGHTLESTTSGRGAESLKSTGDESKTSYIWGFCRVGEEGLQTDTDAEEGLASRDVHFYFREKTGGSELGEAVAEMADAREDELLEANVESDLRCRGRRCIHWDVEDQ